MTWARCASWLLIASASLAKERGAKTKAAAYSSPEQVTIAPELETSNQTEAYMPNKAESRPWPTATATVLVRRSVSSRAVEAGVMNMASAKIAPMASKLATAVIDVATINA